MAADIIYLLCRIKTNNLLVRALLLSDYPALFCGFHGDGLLLLNTENLLLRTHTFIFNRLNKSEKLGSVVLRDFCSNAGYYQVYIALGCIIQVSIFMVPDHVKVSSFSLIWSKWTFLIQNAGEIFVEIIRPLTVIIICDVHKWMIY